MPVAVSTKLVDYTSGVMNQAMVVLNNVLTELAEYMKMSVEERALTENLIRELNRYSDKVDEKSMQYFMDQLALDKYQPIREKVLEGLKEYDLNQQNFQQAMEKIRKGSEALGLTPSQKSDLENIIDNAVKEARSHIQPFAPVFQINPALVHDVTQSLSTQGVPFSIYYGADNMPYVQTTPGYAEVTEAVIKYENIQDRSNQLVFDAKESFERHVQMLHIATPDNIDPKIVCIKNVDEKYAQMIRDYALEKTKFPIGIEKDDSSGKYSIYYRAGDSHTFNALYMQAACELHAPYHKQVESILEQSARNYEEIKKNISKSVTTKQDLGFIIDTNNPIRKIQLKEDGFIVTDLAGKSHFTPKPGEEATADQRQMYKKQIEEQTWIMGRHAAFFADDKAKEAGLTEITASDEPSAELNKLVASKKPHAKMTKEDVQMQKDFNQMRKWIAGSEYYRNEEIDTVIADLKEDPKGFINRLMTEQADQMLNRGIASPENMASLNSFANELSTDSMGIILEHMATDMQKDYTRIVMYPEESRAEFAPPDPGTELPTETELRRSKMMADLSMQIELQLHSLKEKQNIQQQNTDKTNENNQGFDKEHYTQVMQASMDKFSHMAGQIDDRTIQAYAVSYTILQNALDHMKGETSYHMPGAEYMEYIVTKELMQQQGISNPETFNERKAEILANITPEDFQSVTIEACSVVVAELQKEAEKEYREERNQDKYHTSGHDR